MMRKRERAIRLQAAREVINALLAYDKDHGLYRARFGDAVTDFTVEEILGDVIEERPGWDECPTCKTRHHPDSSTGFRVRLAISGS